MGDIADYYTQRPSDLEPRAASVKCDYCNNDAQLVGGDTIYPHRPDLHHLHFWQCAPCDAYCGCHKGTTQPLGRLANAELRQAKQEVHVAFDELWKRTTPAGTFDRNGAYEWLAAQLGIKRKDCHIGMMDLETCQRVVEVCVKHQSARQSTLKVSP